MYEQQITTSQLHIYIYMRKHYYTRRSSPEVHLQNNEASESNDETKERGLHLMSNEIGGRSCIAFEFFSFPENAFQ